MVTPIAKPMIAITMLKSVPLMPCDKAYISKAVNANIPVTTILQSISFFFIYCNSPNSVTKSASVRGILV